jgi:hypothetical protein
VPDAPGGASDASGAEGAQAPKGIEGTAREGEAAGKFAQRLQPSSITGAAVQDAAARSPAAAAVAAPPLGQLAADLAAGRISASAAVDRVVQQVLDRQLGTNAPAAVRAKVETALRDALETDPLLGEKLKRLGG